MTLPSVTVHRRAVDRVKAGHLWIYRSDVQAPEGVAGGSPVRVVDGRGWFVGTAFYSAHSQIALRLLSREDLPVEELLDERLRSAIDLRKHYLPGVPAVRLVHGEGDHLPGLVVDQYADVLSIQTLTEAMDQRKGWLVERLVELTGARAVVERNDVPARRHEGLDQVRGVLRGEVEGPVWYREGEVELRADLLGGQKTGAFLDQRDNHVLAGQLARGRALDCFAYAGGFALQMAKNAESVLAIDQSDTALADLRANAERNGLTNVETKTANAFDFLRSEADAGRKYDTVVLDPPAFTKSRQSIDAALRGYKEINLRGLMLLPSGGLLVTASCSYHVGEEAFAEVVAAAARDAGRPVQILEKRGAGRDHPVLVGVPETRYLKCLFVRAL